MIRGVKVLLGFIIICALVLLGISFYNAVEETVKVLQYAPHIMDIPKK